MKLQPPKPAWVAGGGLCVVVLLICWFLVREEVRHPGYLGSLSYNPSFALREYRARIAFNEIQWKNPGTVPDLKMYPGRLTIRIRMVDSLLNQYNFKGWTRKEIEQLLGPRTVTEYFSDWDLVYYLGAGRYGNAVGDSEWLVFRLDDSGRVRRYEVVHD